MPLKAVQAFAAFWATLLVLTAPVQAQPIPDLTLAELEAAIRDGELGEIRAVSMERGGETVYRKRFGGGEMGERVDIRSAGKSITALAVGAAIADGHLPGTELAVWPYLDAARGESVDAITVADLLSMSSALDCDDWNSRSPGQEEKMYRKRNWAKHVLALPAREYVRDGRGIGPFAYCTAGVFLLGEVVEKATGEPFDRYVQRRLFDPLGIDGADWRRSRVGEVQSGGQLTIADDALLKIGRMVLDGGMWEGERVLPETWLRTMLSPRHALSANVQYGYLWWFSSLRSMRGYEGAAMMKGNGGNIVALVPTLDAVLVVQAENYNRQEAERNAFVVLTTLLRSLPMTGSSD
jgi:CubicO group peptidase (beta-lactamase class C family)